MKLTFVRWEIFRHLNTATIPDYYPLLNFRNFLLPSMTIIFPEIDLVHVYHQILVNLHDIQKTAVIFLFGAFEFLSMLFGLQNTASIFQRFFDEDVRGLDFVFTYINDLLIGSRIPDPHFQHLTQLFKHLHFYDVKINPSKCVFSSTNLEFLEHLIDTDGICLLLSKVETIKYYLPLFLWSSFTIFSNWTISIIAPSLTACRSCFSWPSFWSISERKMHWLHCLLALHNLSKTCRPILLRFLSLHILSLMLDCL